jgi:hypothetical protein
MMWWVRWAEACNGVRRVVEASVWEEEESFGVYPRALLWWQWPWHLKSLAQQEPGSRMRQSRPAVFVADSIQVSIRV